MKIYQLTIIDHSDFSNVRHQSFHATRSGACRHRDNAALPGVLDRTEKAYHTSIECQIESHWLMGAE